MCRLVAKISSKREAEPPPPQKVEIIMFWTWKFKIWPEPVHFNWLRLCHTAQWVKKVRKSTCLSMLVVIFTKHPELTSGPVVDCSDLSVWCCLPAARTGRTWPHWGRCCCRRSRHTCAYAATLRNLPLAGFSSWPKKNHFKGQCQRLRWHGVI